MHKKILLCCAASLASAALLFLSFPDTNAEYCAWIALVPVLILLPKLKPGGAFLTGFFSGFAANAGILYWMYAVLSYNTESVPLSVFMFILYCGYLALYSAVWALLLRVNYEKTSAFVYPFFAASLWVALEYLRMYTFSGYPSWVLLGLSQWKFLAAVQMSSYTGLFGVSFLIVLVNASIASLLKTGNIRVFTPGAGAFAMIVLAGSLTLSVPQKHTLAPINVAVVQANIDQFKKWNNAYEEEIKDAYTGLVDEASESRPAVIVWPETSVPGFLPVNEHFMSWLSGLAKNTRTNQIVGSAYTVDNRNYFNASMLIDPEGKTAGLHFKTHLVPFGEFIPLRKYLVPYLGILNGWLDFTPGSEHNTFKTSSAVYGAGICSENFFGDITRRFVLNGAQVLVNQTNDAWFFKTSAAEQHFSMNIFRAIENRRSVVVSGNTGVSGVVNERGEVIKRIPLFTREIFETSVYPSSELTFYTRFGDLFSYLCICFTAALLLVNLTGIIKP